MKMKEVNATFTKKPNTLRNRNKVKRITQSWSFVCGSFPKRPKVMKGVKLGNLATSMVPPSFTVTSGSRLRVVPHFSSGIVERAKRERAWKSPHARKGDTRRGERKMRDPHFSLSPPRVAFSRVGWFSRALAFCSLYYPWGKMGDYS